MDIKQRAIEILNREYLLNVSMIEPLKTGSAEVLYCSEEAVFIKDSTREVLMLQTYNLKLAKDLLETQPDSALLVAHNENLARFAMNEYGFSKPQPCYQAVYLKEPFDLENQKLSIRPMKESEAELASKMYGFSVEDALEHIKARLVFCGLEGDTIAAMIGMHTQGSMGLLYVDPKFRRKGYAETLEKFLINMQLQKGLVPYAQIVEGNTPSLSLQKKLGLSLSDRMIYWLHRDKNCETDRK